MSIVLNIGYGLNPAVIGTLLAIPRLPAGERKIIPDPVCTEDFFHIARHGDLISVLKVARHLHQLMRQRMLETDDHYVLAKTQDSAGLNLWQ